MDELSEEDKLTVARARKIQRFLSQPFQVAEVFTGHAGKLVPLAETIKVSSMMRHTFVQNIPYFLEYSVHIYPKKLRPKNGMRGLFANYEVGKDSFTQTSGEGRQTSICALCECASTVLTVSALSKLSLFFPCAKQSWQTTECDVR
jgi:hypothetical protein